MHVKAEYICLRCKYKFEKFSHGCPKCGHLYIKWLNYEKYWKDLDIENVKEYSIEGEVDEDRNIKRIDIAKGNAAGSSK